MLGLELNALQNVVHLVLGILGMAAATRSSTARSYGALNILHLVTALVRLAKR
jgi:hypothetical protein